MPGADAWRELVEFCPEAKVVLTVRDPERWYDSLMTLGAKLRDSKLWPTIQSRLATVQRLNRLYQGVDVTDRAATIERFEQHTREVRATVPAERLLVFEVRQGWEPLCEFLGVDVPETEFPRRNDADELERMIAQYAD